MFKQIHIVGKKSPFLKTSNLNIKSTKFNYGSVLDFLYKEHFLKNKLPHFKCLSGQIDILKDPIDFYVELHVKKQKY